MTLKVSIHPETEARLRRLAQQAGKDIGDYVSDLVERAAAAQAGDHTPSPADLDAALNELFAADTRRLPSASLRYSRSDIYTDHD